MELQGIRAIVVGGASGMGAAGVRAYAAAGATVASLDVNDKLGEQVVGDVAGKARHWHCDVSSHSGVAAAFADAIGWLGGLDVLVHTAGIINEAIPPEAITPDELGRFIDVHLRGTVNTNQAAFPVMRDQGRGRIVNFTSMAGIRGTPHGAHYAAVKAGIAAWTRSLAQAWGQYNICVNAVAPVAETPMSLSYEAKLAPAELEQYKAMMASLIPLQGRMGDSDLDIAPVLVFLATEGARYITGQVLSVDGGFMMLGA